MVDKIIMIAAPLSIGYSIYLYKQKKYILAMGMAYVAGVSTMGIVTLLFK